MHLYLHSYYLMIHNNSYVMRYIFIIHMTLAYFKPHLSYNFHMAHPYNNLSVLLLFNHFMYNEFTTYYMLLFTDYLMHYSYTFIMNNNFMLYNHYMYSVMLSNIFMHYMLSYIVLLMLRLLNLLSFLMDMSYILLLMLHYMIISDTHSL